MAPPPHESPPAPASAPALALDEREYKADRTSRGWRPLLIRTSGGGASERQTQPAKTTNAADCPSAAPSTGPGHPPSIPATRRPRAAAESPSTQRDMGSRLTGRPV